MGLQDDNTIDRGTIKGWRLIALYLGVSASTARRWEKWYGLPVMSMPGGRVMTSKSLIDQWIMTRVRLRREAMLAGNDNQEVSADTSKAEPGQP